MPEVKTKTQLRKRAELQQQVATAVRKVTQAQHKTAALYAEVVRAVVEARKYGLSRSRISKAIVQETDRVKGYRGASVRYIRLARWEMAEFLPGEKKVSEVTIEDHTYKSPVRALESELFSFTRVYRAWSETVRPLPLVAPVAGSLGEGVERLAKRLTIVTKEGRVKVMESPEAMAALLRVLNASPLMKAAQQMASETLRAPRRARKAA